MLIVGDYANTSKTLVIKDLHIRMGNYQTVFNEMKKLFDQLQENQVITKSQFRLRVAGPQLDSSVSDKLY